MDRDGFVEFVQRIFVQRIFVEQKTKGSKVVTRSRSAKVTAYTYVEMGLHKPCTRYKPAI